MFVPSQLDVVAFPANGYALRDANLQINCIFIIPVNDVYNGWFQASNKCVSRVLITLTDSCRIDRVGAQAGDHSDREVAVSSLLQ